MLDEDKFKVLQGEIDETYMKLSIFKSKKRQNLNVLSNLEKEMQSHIDKISLLEYKQANSNL
jgi:hypothetical protein